MYVSLLVLFLPSQLTSNFLLYARSLCSKNTVRPLRISEDAFNKLRKEYALGDELADLANSFGYKPLDEESGYGGMTVSEKEKGIHGNYSIPMQRRCATYKDRHGIPVLIPRGLQDRRPSFVDHATGRRIPSL